MLSPVAGRWGKVAIPLRCRERLTTSMAREFGELGPERIKSYVECVGGSVPKFPIDLDDRSCWLAILLPHCCRSVLSHSGLPLHFGEAPQGCAHRHVSHTCSSACPTQQGQAETSPPLASQTPSSQDFLPFPLLVLLPDMQIHVLLSGRASTRLILSLQLCFTPVRRQPDSPG